MEDKRTTWYRRPWAIPVIALIVMIGVLFLIPVPYYIMQPGSALEVRPMIQVKDTRSKEKGSFYMTTVAMREGNLLGWVAAKIDSTYQLVPKQKVLGEGENPKEYEKRQAEIMHASQQDAVLAAFHQAKRPVSEKLLGVQVFRLIEDMPAEKVLKEGDLIKKADGKRIRRSEELVGYLSGKKPGEKVQLTVKRNGKLTEKELRLGTLDASSGVKRAGIGIQPVTLRKVTTKPEVNIHADSIGGPSAGLMFSLEIINQIGGEDLTRGYRVAGTGTITPEGEVGQIGGVQHKVAAADEKGADIFFVPADRRPGDSNEKRAVKTARQIGTDMKVVPVKTLGDAITYLKKLPRDHSEKNAA
ncbi:SepM family pheromone-processing serine protease [Salinithrix halophila]|uniref:endopeptidase La n=1 Tax=Salinithrix halophila TaxID=1485204 RepID=A0ABV8JF52_9BACL